MLPTPPLPPPPPPPPPVGSSSLQTDIPKLKKLNWKSILPFKIPKNSVWLKCDVMQPLPDDICTKLTEKFSSKPPKKIVSTSKTNICLRVIDLKNAQNILIGLRTGLKHASHDEVKKYILRCDTTKLNVDFINGLIRSLPQPHQIQLLELKSSGVQLIDVEDFLANLCDISRLLPRLLFMKFKIGFDEMVQKLKSDFKTSIAACEEVTTCQKFDKILHLILLIGNFMNAGSNLGQATAFELSILANLNDVKSADNQRTLLQSIAEFIEEKWPELVDFGDRMVHVQEAAHVNSDDVENTVKEIDQMLTFMKTELKSASEFQTSSEDKFVDEMSNFASKCEDKLQELTKMQKHMQNSCTQVAHFFAFDMKKYRIAECFQDIAKFEKYFTGRSKKKTGPKEELSTGCKITKKRKIEIDRRDFKIKLDRLSSEGLYFYFYRSFP